MPHRSRVVLLAGFLGTAAAACLQVTYDTVERAPPGLDGGVLCEGVYCAGFYTCDPDDGTCKCGGNICQTGNCDDFTQECLPGCGTGACGASSSDSALAFTGEGCSGASAATKLPDAVVGQPYLVEITAVCGTPPYNFASATPPPPYLSVVPNGEVLGTPGAPGGPYEFLVKVDDAAGKAAYQNFVVSEVAQ